MTRRRSLNSKQREALYERERGDRAYPLCNLCGLEITAGQAWEESHFPIPHALDGTAAGVAHFRCNRDHGAKIVTPIVAKVKRVRRNYIGAKLPGSGSRPMPCGRTTSRSKTMRNGIIPRLTHSQKHAIMRAKREVR